MRREGLIVGICNTIILSPVGNIFRLNLELAVNEFSEITDNGPFPDGRADCQANSDAYVNIWSFR